MGASERLAADRDPFPAWEESIREEPMRNVTTTTVAPTGTISLVAGCSAGIEPMSLGESPRKEERVGECDYVFPGGG